MNKKRIIILGIIIIAVFGMLACARSNNDSNSQEVFDEVNQTNKPIDTLPSTIESQNTSDQSKAFLAIPVFSSQKLFFDNGMGIFLGRDVGVDKDFPNTRPDFIGRILAAFPTNAIREANENKLHDFRYGCWRPHVFVHFQGKEQEQRRRFPDHHAKSAFL